MRKYKILWFVGFLLSMALMFYGFTAGATWERHIRAGQLALSLGNYDAAEQQFLAALHQSEQFGPEDARYRESLNYLASVYQAETRSLQSEPLYSQAQRPTGSAVEKAQRKMSARL